MTTRWTTWARWRTPIPERRRVVVALVAACGAIGAVFALIASPVAAHSGLAAASPAPGAVVGGEITEIELFYGDVITGIEASVTAPDGTVLTTDARLDSTIEATIVLPEPLAEPGEYAVRHTIVSFDGDEVEAAYLFTYDPDAPPPQLVFLDETGEGDEPGDRDVDHDDGTSAWVWIVAGGGALLIVVLAIRLLLAIRRARA